MGEQDGLPQTATAESRLIPIDGKRYESALTDLEEILTELASGSVGDRLIIPSVLAYLRIHYAMARIVYRQANAEQKQRFLARLDQIAAGIHRLDTTP